MWRAHMIWGKQTLYQFNAAHWLKKIRVDVCVSFTSCGFTVSGARRAMKGEVKRRKTIIGFVRASKYFKENNNNNNNNAQVKSNV